MKKKCPPLHMNMHEKRLTIFPILSLVDGKGAEVVIREETLIYIINMSFGVVLKISLLTYFFKITGRKVMRQTSSRFFFLHLLYQFCLTEIIS